MNTCDKCGTEESKELKKCSRCQKLCCEKCWDTNHDLDTCLECFDKYYEVVIIHGRAWKGFIKINR